MPSCGAGTSDRRLLGPELLSSVGITDQVLLGRAFAPHAGERHEVTDPAGGREGASDDDRVTLGQAIVDLGAPAGGFNPSIAGPWHTGAYLPRIWAG